MSVTWQLLVGDVRDQLAQLGPESVQCVVTSPPYWGVRDYGTATWEGGDAVCDHQGEPHRTASNINANTGTGTDRKNAERRQFFRETCGKCGARRVDAQLGLEPTPGAYVANMVAVFRAVRRVLRDDGTLWLNLGDSYNGQNARDPNIRKNGTLSYRAGGRAVQVPGLKPKDLVGMPWRVAFALQADGWYLRSDIIWHKPNPMPESVTDRPTKAHEYLFLLTKSARYFYDADAIKEPVTGNAHARGDGLGRKARSVEAGNHRGRPKQNESFSAAVSGLVSKRNRRTVWTIPTQPFSGAHFAVFPPALVIPCVKAGSAPGDTVLDPFAGSGTTLLVANDHQRHAIGIELNPEYVEMARKRLRARNPLFAREVNA